MWCGLRATLHIHGDIQSVVCLQDLHDFEAVIVCTFVLFVRKSATTLFGRLVRCSAHGRSFARLGITKK